MNLESKTPTADELAVEVVALRERVAELEAGAKLGLNWREIPEDVEILLAEQVPIFTHIKSLDVKGANPGPSAHLLIEGDNLHALYTLQATHKGRVDVIYIDPPYNTGKEFMYNDKLIDKENRWRHSAWLSFMEKRLVLALDLLADAGVIFVSIDDNEVARLRLLCDTIFGEKAFIGMFIWEKKRKASNLDGSIRGITEYVMCYARGGARPLVHPSDEVEDAKPYPFYNTGNTRGILKFPIGMDFTKLADGVYQPGKYPDKKTLVTLLDKVTIKNGHNLDPFRLEGAEVPLK